MSAGHVPTANLTALYNNTTPGTTADPAALDNAVADIVSTVNANADDQNQLISAGTLSRLGIINVKDYGASGSDTTTTGNLASGSKVLVVTSTDTFEEGHGISVAGAGEAGADLVTSITSIVGTNVFLADEASTTVSGATVSHDDTAAIQAAIDAVETAGGGIVFLPNGSYSISEIVVPYTGIHTSTSARIVLQGSGRSTRLVANTINKTMVRFAGSYGAIRDLQINGNSLTGIIGLGVVPEDETQTTTNVWQNYNVFERLWIHHCTEGIVFRAGPDVAGADSGCWYNILQNSHIYSCLRGVWFRDPTNSGGSPANRNMLVNVRIGNNTNTGIQIDSADTCQFVNVNFEGITTGTSPNTTPTGLIVQDAGANGSDNNHNRFINCVFESCTKDTDISNVRTIMIGVVGTVEGSAVPDLMGLLPTDVSQTPLVLPGLVYPEGSGLSPYLNGHWNLRKSVALVDGSELFDYETATVESHEWQTFALSTGNVAGVTSFAQTVSKYRRISGMVEWHFRFQFRSSGATSVDIQLPVPPDTSTYLQHNTIVPMAFPLILNDGTGVQLRWGEFSNHTVSPTVLKVSSADGTWETTGNNNSIRGMIQYMAAGY